MKVTIKSNNTLKITIDGKLKLFYNNLQSSLTTVGQSMKQSVLGANRLTDLKQSGHLLSYLQSEIPRVYEIETDGGGKAFGIGYGNINMLNHIFRPPQTVTIEKNKKFFNVTLKGEQDNSRGRSPFPYWIAEEFGILSKSKPISPQFASMGLSMSSKGESEYGPKIFGVGAPSGHSKPIYIMVKKDKGHSGVAPSEIFRQGFASVVPMIMNIFDDAVRETWV